MESRFAHLRQRDNSVSMLRVRMSRRRSQTQKENRERVVNTRRRLSALSELDVSSLDASVALAKVSVFQENKHNTSTQPKAVAGEERLKQLQRWKERKALEKEKEKREKSSKGVFKTGLYHHKDSLTVKPLPPVPAAPGRARETKESAAPSSRVTRSMKQQQAPKPLKMLDGNTAGKKPNAPVERATRLRGAAPKPAPHVKTKAEPASRGSSTRTRLRPPVTAAMKDEAQARSAGQRSTRSRAAEAAPPPAAGKKNDKKTVPEKSMSKVEPEEDKAPGSDPEEDKAPGPESEEDKAPGPESEEDKAPGPESEEDKAPGPESEEDKAPGPESEEDKAPGPESEEVEEMAVEPTVPAPAAVPDSSSNTASFAPEGFLFQAPTGLSSFKFDPMTPRTADAFLTPSSSFTLPAAPVFDDEPQEENKPSPPKSLRCSPPAAETEQKHDVLYFRSEISSETERLTGLCALWEAKVEDEAIPEEMRDGMRTAVGQARLLMKERFKQFSGLVDDCEFSRGEKVTTCTDLQGFWDMVYFQVEDVNKKFDALKAAEARGWVEEYKPPPQRKVVKKAAPAASKPAGTKAAAKSRLAAAKAAMKARQQAALAEQAEDAEQHSQDAAPVTNSTDTVVNTGVQSPEKLPACVRRSSRLSSVALPPPSPSSNCLTPRRATRRSLALTPKPSMNLPTSHQHPETATPASRPHPETATPASRPHPETATSASRPHPETATPASRPHPETNTPAATPQCERSVHVPQCFSPVTEMSSGCTEQASVPSIAVEQDKPAEDLRTDSLSQSPSPLTSPASSVSMSFTLSPCTAQLSSPVVRCTPGPAALNFTPEAKLDSTAATPDCSVNEDLPGIDFERYLQPSLRDSLSPRKSFAMESPVAMDVEMESPRSQSEERLTQQDTDSGVSAAALLCGHE